MIGILGAGRSVLSTGLAGTAIAIQNTVEAIRDVSPVFVPMKGRTSRYARGKGVRSGTSKYSPQDATHNANVRYITDQGQIERISAKNLKD